MNSYPKLLYSSQYQQIRLAVMLEIITNRVILPKPTPDAPPVIKAVLPLS